MAKLNNRPWRPAAQGLPEGCRGTVQDRWEGGLTSSLAVRVDFRPFEGFERLAAPGLLLAVPLTSVVATGLGSVRGVAECSTAALLSRRAARCVACRRPRNGRLVPPWPKGAVPELQIAVCLHTGVPQGLNHPGCTHFAPCFALISLMFRRLSSRPAVDQAY